MQDLEKILAQEKDFTAALEELKTLDPLVEEFMQTEPMRELREKVKQLNLRQTELKQQLGAHRKVLQRCVSESSHLCMHHRSLRTINNLFHLRSCAALWTSFQHEKETLVEQMNDEEGKMSMFTTAKAISLQQAEEKCQRYKVGNKLTIIYT